MDDHYRIVIGQKSPQSSVPEQEPEAEVHEQEESRRGNIFIDIAKFSILALLIVTPFRFYVAQPFIVSGSSMTPTFEPKEYLVVDEISYRFEKPERGDVVIFKYPLDPSVFFIKRIVGLPGETIEMRNGDVYVQADESTAGEVLSEPYRSTSGAGKDMIMQLDEDEYYVMGDNRAASADSRTWGPLPERFIIGKAFARLLPVEDMTLFPGKYEFE